MTATWTTLHPDRPVTIGVPLPTYAVVDPRRARTRRPLPRGRIGEIGIAGVGLARGYVNRDDLTAQAFIPDFLGIPDNPSAGSTAPATSAGSPTTARSSTSAASTRRSRSAATASS